MKCGQPFDPGGPLKSPERIYMESMAAQPGGRGRGPALQPPRPEPLEAPQSHDLPTPATSGTPMAAEPLLEAPARRRGRPPGSKNKVKA